jgi:hypothetical protein
VEVGGSKRMPWMTGFHGEKTLLLLKRDKKKGFKGAGEMPNICRELIVSQKGYPQRAREPLASWHTGLNSLRELFSKRT